MTAEIPPSGPAWRAAEVRMEDMRRLGFKEVRRGTADAAKHRGFKHGEVIVSGRSPCGKYLRAGLSGPIQPCGARCTCVEGKA